MNPDYRILLAGNPNVGKSTVFNGLTGLKQHTGNWSGKTVALASGTFTHQNSNYEVLDLPGTYSLISNSPEEEIARDAICSQHLDLVLVVADATNLARNLNLLLQILEITPHVALCINLLDEAKKNRIFIDIEKLKQILSIPVIGITAHRRGELLQLKKFLAFAVRHETTKQHSQIPVLYPKPIEDAISIISAEIPDNDCPGITRRACSLNLLIRKKMPDLAESQQNDSLIMALHRARTLLTDHGISNIILWDTVVETLINQSLTITEQCITMPKSQELKFSHLDQLLTSKWSGIPITIAFFALLLWITISGANIPSTLLMNFFLWFKPRLIVFFSHLSFPSWLLSFLIDGIYQTTTWVIAVMLPPMMIFFPLFTFLEDLGFLPRLAFNLDRCFKKSGGCGKQALTMCMGLGCNAVGVTGCRIISDRQQRLSAMVTNCFMPCNGRFSLLITLATLFIGNCLHNGVQSLLSSFFLLLLLFIGIFFTLLITALITRFFSKNPKTSFYLELPPYRKPKISQILVRSFLDRTFRILWRAIRVSIPTGALIWIMANLSFQGTSILSFCANFLDPYGRLLGMDGIILMAFLLALPANEIFLPIVLMGYLSSGTMTDTPTLLTLKSLLLDHGWTTLTALCVMLFSVLHFPCGTTLLTIKKESGSSLWTFLGFLIPTVVATSVCILITWGWNLCSNLF